VLSRCRFLTNEKNSDFKNPKQQLQQQQQNGMDTGTAIYGRPA